MSSLESGADPAPARDASGREAPVAFSFCAYGVAIEVRASDTTLLEAARRCLPKSASSATGKPAAEFELTCERAASGSADAPVYVLSVHGAEISRSRNRDTVLERLESEMRIAIADHAPAHVFVHAGVVGWHGRAIVIPGRSFSGKSTLVAELVRAGAEYYSDEYAVCTLDGHVHPYAKPLEVRDEGERVQRKLDLREIAGAAGTVALRAGLVLVTRFEKGATWKPQAITTGAGVLELLDNTVSARRSPENALAALGELAKDATVLKGERGDARETAEAVLARFASWENPAPR